MFTLDFTDKSVTYDTFIHDVAHQWFECLLTHATTPKWLVSDKHTQCSVAVMWIDGANRVK